MKSKLLLTSISTIVGLYGVLILFLIILFNIANWSLSYLLIISIAILLLQFLLAPFFMDLTMKWFYKVNFNVTIPEYLNEFIKEVCEKNSMKYPKIGYIDDGTPNAFTYGRTKNDARIILTKGIFELLSQEEVKTVVSHEIGHAAHYDMFLMTAVQIVPLILYYMYDTLTTTKNDNKKNNFAIIGMLAYVLYIISEYVILWFSRTREYYADEFAIKATSNPNALASALVKIGYGLTTSQNTKTKVNTVSALGIFDSKASKTLVISSYDEGNISKENINKAARWELWNPWAKWYEFNSTHPLISKRIKAISNYSNQYNQESFIVFDENKPESYFDDFILELIIKFLPFIVLIVFAIMVILRQDLITNYRMFLGICLIFLSITMLLSYSRSHKNKGYKESNVSELLSEVKVSGVTSVPCIVKGEIIGKGSPGYIFSEDFVIKDNTGIIFLDYRQPLALINALFALLKSKKYINKNVEIKGWYRRNPIPYIEIYEMTVDGKVKKCYSYIVNKILLYALLIFGLIISILPLIQEGGIL